MPRTTAGQVLGILGLEEAIVSLDPFIQAANMIVTEACGESGYDDDRMEMIERWLAAHYYCSADPRVSYEVTGPLATTFQYKNGLFLANTSFGQMALTLDTQGNLALLSKNMEEGRKKTIAGISYLGSPRCPVVEDPLD